MPPVNPFICTADTFARNGRDLPITNSADLIPLEIPSLLNCKLLSCGTSHQIITGMLLVALDSLYRAMAPRALQLPLPRLRSEQLKLMKFQNGEENFPPCSCFFHTSPTHLVCMGLSWKHLMVEWKRIFELLVRRDLLDLA
ncbi:hypothetical protein TNCV_2192791 [Trichonephila clavipes]|nr:hypothetical protein TNCV_2192791 [Trichonephila clavipes]